MVDELTDSQIELLCEIEEHDHTTLTGDRRRDFERLLSDGYVQPTKGDPAFKLAAKGGPSSRSHLLFDDPLQFRAIFSGTMTALDQA